MNQEQKAQEEVNRGDRARDIIENELYQDALVSIKGELFMKLENTKFHESEQRDEIWRQLQTVKWFEQYLQQVLETGKLGRQTLGILSRFKK